MKLKYSLISKLNTLSAREMDLLLYALRHADETTGITEGVYYRDVMEDTGMCKQSFYNALNGLAEKGIIVAEKGSGIDYNITVPGNEFPDAASCHDGYINLNRQAFRRFHFQKLKAHEKYLLFEFLKVTHKNRGSWCIKTGSLYEKFAGALHVTRRVIRGYLHRLKEFFAIGIKEGKYYITYKSTVFEPRAQGRGEEKQRLDFLVRKECNRLHISFGARQLEDTADLVQQYRQWTDSTRMMVRLLMQCIRASIQGMGRKDRELNPAYIHKLVREALELA